MANKPGMRTTPEEAENQDAEKAALEDQLARFTSDIVDLTSTLSRSDRTGLTNVWRD